MSETIREAFEARFPTPLCARWDAEKGCYYTVHGDAPRRRVIEKYNARWEAWQAALAIRTTRDLVLPHPVAYMSPNGGVVEAYISRAHALEKCRKLGGEPIPLVRADEVEAVLTCAEEAAAVPVAPVVSAVGTEDMAAHSLTARLDTALEFLRHVKKCLVRNGEYAPLSHQELDSIIGIHPPAGAHQPDPVAVPADWKLVPVELTPEMYNAFGYVKEVPFVIWKKVLSAAPAAPVASQKPVAWTWQGALDELKGYCPDGVAVFGHKGPGVPLPLYTAPPGVKRTGTVEVERHTLARYADHLQTAGYNNAADDLRTLLAGGDA